MEYVVRIEAIAESIAVDVYIAPWQQPFSEDEDDGGPPFHSQTYSAADVWLTYSAADVWWAIVTTTMSVCGVLALRVPPASIRYIFAVAWCFALTVGVDIVYVHISTVGYLLRVKLTPRETM